MSTGENEQALRKILDMTRMLSIIILVIHLYHYGHFILLHAGYTHLFIDRIFINVRATGLFGSEWNTIVMAFLLLIVSLIGVTGKKEVSVKPWPSLILFSAGSFILLTSHCFFIMPFQNHLPFEFYILLLIIGYLLSLSGGTRLTRFVQLSLDKDIFNSLNESFPQEERLLENEYSVNLPAQYLLKGKVRKSWINFINLFRGLLVIGTPGAGKSYFVIRHVITQLISKGFAMFVYDFKFADLSVIAYNALRKYWRSYKIAPKFYVIDFEKIYHRCNPLDPLTMEDITDASESSRSIMLGLNRDWIKKQGDFFVESPINFVTAIIWFLRKHQEGKYCTLPHVIELMQLDYRTLFPLLATENEIEVLINPFESAYRHEAWEQLEGQIASAKIGMARLSSPQLYYVLAGNDFTLDINNPDEPKIVCMGNNPQKQQIFGAVLSLYISRLIKIVNKKGKMKCAIIGDEFPTAYWPSIDVLLATARANLVAIILAIQDFSQLVKDYGKEQAQVIMNIVGNVIAGQVVGETAKSLSERFGKIVQHRESVSINRMDTSVSHSTQLDSAIPPSKIASLSSGEFVGMVADDPENKIALKTFHAEILNDHAAIKKETDKYKQIPSVRNVSAQEIQQNYLQIKEDIQDIIRDLLPNAA